MIDVIWVCFGEVLFVMGDEVGLYLVFGLFDVCDDCVVM